MRALFNPKTLATLTAFGFSALVFPEDNKVKVSLGDLSDLPENEMRRVQVGENKENYIVVLKKHGRVQAFSGKCCHFGAPLDTGYFDGKKIWCPWHLARFCSFSGELIGGPGLNSLKKYKVERQQDGQYSALVDQDSASASQVSARMVKPNYEADKRTFVIVGGGQVAQNGAEQLRKSGFQGRIVIISNEKQPPYDRIILTKSMRAEASKLNLRNEQFYQDYGIELKLNSEATQICTQTKNVVLASGEKVPFDKLLLATGTRPKVVHKNVVGNKNVFTIRSAEDHSGLRRQLADAKNVVVVGGSFIGMEVAWAIKKDFKDKNVTVFEAEEKPLQRIFGTEIAAQLVDLQRRNGVEVLANQAVKSFNSENGAIVSITYTLNDEFRGPRDVTVPADVVVLATGSQLNSNYVPSCLLNPDGSVAVDSHMQTNHPDIYAAGDIARYYSLLTQSQERTEHWAVAGDQAIVAAKNMLDQGVNYTNVPFFWTNQWVNAQFVGYNSDSDWYHTVTFNEQGAEKTARITFFFKGHKVIGAAIINCPGAAIKLALALENGLMPSRGQICNGKVTYQDIVKRVESAKQSCCH